MNKEIYLVQGSESESYGFFKQRILSLVADIRAASNPDSIKFSITEKAPPVISIIPFNKKKAAAISVYNPSGNTIQIVRKIEGFRGAYRVQEALPVSYQKNWKDGEPSPGVCLLTFFSKKKNIDYATFINRWHNGHTPLSLRFHPLWNYVRSEVKEILAEDSCRFNGIVEEQMKTASDLLNPFRFFGNPFIIIPRMIMVYADTKSFIDYPTMETYLATEYIIKSS